MLDTASPTAQPDLLRQLLDPILAGDDVTLFIRGEDGRELLDAAAEHLATLRCRTFRVNGTAPEGLSLQALMEQTIGQPVPGGGDDEFLKRGFQALTALDGTCDRIILLISDANTLRPTALRYIQLACRAGTNLQLVLAGKRGFLDLLSHSEFAYLRKRLATGPIVTPLPPEPMAARSTTQRPRFIPETAAPQALGPVMREPGRPVLSSSADASQRKRLVALGGIGLGMAACVGLIVWLGGSDERAIEQQAMLTIEAPVIQEVAPKSPDVPAIPEKPAAPAKSVAAAPEPAPAPFVAPVPQTAPTSDLKQEAAPPVVASPSAPAVPPPRPVKSVSRRPIPAPTRTLAVRTPSLDANGVAAWEDPYSPPSRDWQPLPPRQAMSEMPDQQTSYIGTYTTDANGIRVFRYGR